MEYKSVPRKTVQLWQARIAVVAAVLIAAVCFLSFISVWLLIIPAVIAIALPVLIFWYIPAFFASYEISFPDGAIVITRGVLIKSTHIMPFSRLVYAQSMATPLSRLLGLSALSLKAARSHLLIPELEKDAVDAFIKAVTKGAGK